MTSLRAGMKKGHFGMNNQCLSIETRGKNDGGDGVNNLNLINNNQPQEGVIKFVIVCALLEWEGSPAQEGRTRKSGSGHGG